MTRIHIAPPPPAPDDYDIVIRPGALDDLPALIDGVVRAHRFALIADANVADRFGAAVLDRLQRAGMRAELLTFTAGEARKTRESWAMLTDAMLERGIGRDGCVIALGGGVTGDLAAFVAATYMRGIPVVQVPTTLLAMVDASVGGKTGVDTRLGKNLIGVFHQPRLVIADPMVLETLPAPELRAGLAEAVKHGAIADADYLRRIERNADRLLAREPDALTDVIRRSVQIKADFVSLDPLEGGARKALNFGHTIGHAIESLSSFALLHGFAVAIGMVAEAEIGEAAGITASGTAGTLRSALDHLGLPTRLPEGVDAELVLEHARRDKKARQDRIYCTLLERPGAVARSADGDWAVPLDDELLRAVLRRVSP